MGYLAAALAITAVLGACGSEPTTQDGRVQIVTTVAPITSLTANIVGDRADVTGIVPEGTNSHTFEPPPSVAEKLADADVVFLNGLQLEEPTKKIAKANKKPDTLVVELGNLAIAPSEYQFDFSFPKEEGRPNPHLWTSPPMAVEYARIIKNTMVKRDPDNASYYEANFREFDELIGRFDSAMRESFATIPERDRKLLTYHDAYAYFAAEYQWQIVGAIQVSDFEDPTPAEVADLIDQIRREDVRAIFGSEVFPSPVLEQIGKEAGVRYVDELRDDDLPGTPGSRDHSWLGLMRFDYVTMVEALGGDAAALTEFPVQNVAPDAAHYPQ